MIDPKTEYWIPPNAQGSDGVFLARDMGYTLTQRPQDSRIELNWGGSKLLPLGATFDTTLDVEVIQDDDSSPYVVWQAHDNSGVPDLNPWLQIEHSSGNAVVRLKHHVETPIVKANVVSIVLASLPRTRLATWRLQGKVSLTDGSVTAWRDGNVIGHYDGPLGYNTAVPSWAKAGIYAWTSGRTKNIVVRSMATLSVA